MSIVKPAQNTETPPLQKLKAGIAIFLLMLGFLGVIWISNQLILLIKAPEEIALINRFITFGEQGRIISLPEGNIELPPSFNFTVGVFLYIGALGIAVSMTKLLISSGISLLESQMDRLLNWIRDELVQMKRMEK